MQLVLGWGMWAAGYNRNLQMQPTQGWGTRAEYNKTSSDATSSGGGEGNASACI